MGNFNSRSEWHCYNCDKLHGGNVITCKKCSSCHDKGETEYCDECKTCYTSSDHCCICKQLTYTEGFFWSLS